MSAADEDKAKVARAQALRAAFDNWAEELQRIELLARITRARYLALVKEGFTPAEALTLCRL